MENASNENFDKLINSKNAYAKYQLRWRAGSTTAAQF